MMKTNEIKRSGVMIYEDLASSIEKLPDELAGRLVKDYLCYSFTGAEPDYSESLILDVLWANAKSQTDRDYSAYSAKVMKNKYAAYCKNCKQRKIKALCREDWEECVVKGIDPFTGCIEINSEINQVDDDCYDFSYSSEEDYF